MIVCVTGAGGFIGSAVARALLLRNEQVIGIDNLSARKNHPHTKDQWTPLLDHPNFHGLELDIRSGDLTACLLDLKQTLGGIDSICHFAAKPGVRGSHLQRAVYNSINVDGTQALLNAAKSIGINRVLFASSSCVYGNGKVPFVEVSPSQLPQALSHYGWTKIQGELLVENWAESISEAKAIVLRLFSVYGEDMRTDLAIPIFREHLLSGEAVPIFGNGEDSRDYTHIDDVVRAVLLALDRFRDFSSTTSFFNVGRGSSTSTLELLHKVAHHLGCKPKVARMQSNKEEMCATLACTKKATQELDFTAERSLSDGLQLMFSV